jgi:hypothetical protein
VGEPTAWYLWTNTLMYIRDRHSHVIAQLPEDLW